RPSHVSLSHSHTHTHTHTPHTHHIGFEAIALTRIQLGALWVRSGCLKAGICVRGDVCVCVCVYVCACVCVCVCVREQVCVLCEHMRTCAVSASQTMECFC